MVACTPTYESIPFCVYLILHTCAFYMHRTHAYMCPGNFRTYIVQEKSPVLGSSQLYDWCTVSTLCAENVSNTPNFLCTGDILEMSPLLFSSCMQYFHLCHLSFVLRNVPEMSCTLAYVLATRNVSQILPYTVPGNVNEMSKVSVVENIHTMNRKFELPYTGKYPRGNFHVLSGK